jgi:hypothetical protein
MYPTLIHPPDQTVVGDLRERSAFRDIVILYRF